MATAEKKVELIEGGKVLEFGKPPFVVSGLGRVYILKDGKQISNKDMVNLRKAAEAKGEAAPEHDVKYGYQINVGVANILAKATPEQIQKLAGEAINRKLSVMYAALASATEADITAEVSEFVDGGWAVEKVRERKAPAAVTPVVREARSVHENGLAYLVHKKSIADVTKDELKALRERQKAEEKANHANWQNSVKIAEERLRAAAPKGFV